jgi:ribonucleotide monophosphatase NagD (HAD superfamily)
VTASGVDPTLAGKPHEPIARIVRDALGLRGMVVGDRSDTDGEFAMVLGYEFGLVLSGVTASNSVPAVPAPDLIASDLHALVRLALSRSDEAH